MTNLSPTSSKGVPKELPYSTVALILGVISLNGALCTGLPGIVIGIIGILFSSWGNKILLENPNEFSEQSIRNLKAGKVSSYFGVIAGIIVFLFFVLPAFFSAFQNPNPQFD